MKKGKGIEGSWKVKKSERAWQQMPPGSSKGKLYKITVKFKSNLDEG